ncbi:MAG: O-methyltransferase [Acidimicrobiia bacterium]|nr:O-methyltransferase [Acidimicrobiia bacterium]
MPMTPERWAETGAYAREVFGAEPPHIEANRVAALAAGLPTWAVTGEIGRFLALIAKATKGELALEIGTLGGYSALWLLEGLSDAGRVITIESVDTHADFAEAEFKRHGVAERVDVRRGLGLDVLPEIADDVGPGSVDVVFIDADKESYFEYYEATADLVAPGGFLVVDNIFGTGSSWIDDLSDPGMAAADRMNRRAARDDRFDTAGLFARAGLLVARRR